MIVEKKAQLRDEPTHHTPRCMHLRIVITFAMIQVPCPRVCEIMFGIDTRLGKTSFEETDSV